MSDSQNFGFAKLVPGFDFLQNLAKGTSEALPQMPGLSSWIAPTLNVEELEKRIQELRAVQFWLDQNATALKATIQALEVQKMTLATLKGMNVGMNELAEAMRLKPQPAAATASKAAPEAAPPEAKARRDKPAEVAGAAPGVVDPLQWWGSLTQQFQHIAATAMQDAAQKTQEVADAVNAHAAQVAQEAKAPARKKAPARRPAARKTSTTPRRGSA